MLGRLSSNSRVSLSYIQTRLARVTDAVADKVAFWDCEGIRQGAHEEPGAVPCKTYGAAVPHLYVDVDHVDIRFFVVE
jgi:hypothetical protein